MNKQKKNVMTWLFILQIILGIGLAIDIAIFDKPSPIRLFLFIPLVIAMFVFWIGWIAARVGHYIGDND